MIVFLGRSSGGKCGFVAWVSWETCEIWWITTTQDAWQWIRTIIMMAIIVANAVRWYHDQILDADLLSLCKASTLTRDIKSADVAWHCMTAPMYCMWTNFTLERNALRIPSPWQCDEPLFFQVKGATPWSWISWSTQHLNSSFFQRCHHWNDQTFYPSICV